jgi:hypothetical protein
MKKVFTTVLALVMFVTVSYSRELMMNRFSSFEDEVYKINDTQEYSSIGNARWDSNLKNTIIKGTKIVAVVAAAVVTGLMGVNFYKTRQFKKALAQDRAFIERWKPFRRERSLARHNVYGVPYTEASPCIDLHWLVYRLADIFKRYKNRGWTIAQVDALFK